MTPDDARAILRAGYPITPDELDQLLANTWDEAHDAGFKYGCDIGGDVVWEPEFTPNPYRASETA